MYSTVTVIKNMYSIFSVARRVSLKSSHHKKKISTMWKWIIMTLWSSYPNIYNYQVIMFYTQNYYDGICQAYLNFLKKEKILFI